MEQLHQEMSEIRRAIINCIDMQVKLQNSIKDEVVTAFNQLGKLYIYIIPVYTINLITNFIIPDYCKYHILNSNAGKKDNVKSPSGDECKSKRNCIICHEKLVNALLYR